MLPRKVIHLVEDMHVGGLEQVIATIAHRLSKDKYHTAVWCLADGGPLADELRNKGVEVRILNVRNYHNPFELLSLASELRNAKIDILHMHGYFAATAGRLAALWTRIPLRIVHMHTVFYNLGSRHVKMEHWLNRTVQHLIYVSQAVQESFTVKGYNCCKKYSVIYNGSDGVDYTDRNFDVSEKVILCVGSLTKHKGQIHLIEAMRMVHQQMPHVSLWLAGDGLERTTLHQAVEAAGLNEFVQFLGCRRDVPDLLRQAHLCVVPSVREGLGVAAIEAMASGLPVVASDTGGLKEVVVQGGTGVLCPPGHPADLAGAMVGILTNPEQSRRMGLAGRKRYEENFTVEQMIQQMDNIYDSA